jgi:hypothetical protein
MAATTVIVNHTQEPMHMKVGNQRHFADLTTVAKGAKYTMRVDFNTTYQEFLMGVDAQGKKLIVSSDDCCDYKCITVKEVNGKFDVHKEPRLHVVDTTTSSTDGVAAKKPMFSSWKLWR